MNRFDSLTAGLLRAVNATYGSLDSLGEYIANAKQSPVRPVRTRRLENDLAATEAIYEHLRAAVAARIPQPKEPHPHDGCLHFSIEWTQHAGMRCTACGSALKVVAAT